MKLEERTERIEHRKQTQIGLRSTVLDLGKSENCLRNPRRQWCVVGFILTPTTGFRLNNNRGLVTCGVCSCVFTRGDGDIYVARVAVGGGGPKIISRKSRNLIIIDPHVV